MSTEPEPMGGGTSHHSFILSRTVLSVLMINSTPSSIGSRSLSVTMQAIYAWIRVRLEGRIRSTNPRELGAFQTGERVERHTSRIRSGRKSSPAGRSFGGRYGFSPVISQSVKADITSQGTSCERCGPADSRHAPPPVSARRTDQSTQC